MQYFEDFHVGQRIPFDRYTVAQNEIVEFAQRYDPQVFHVDEGHSLTAELGGIMASGWHSTAIFMRLAVDAYLGNAAVLTSPGVDELRWLAPVRAGDIVTGEAVIERASRGITAWYFRINPNKSSPLISHTNRYFDRAPACYFEVKTCGR
jgi:acyl dehydratase